MITATTPATGNGGGFGVPDGMTVQRPTAAQWLRYAYGGELPERYHGWVLYDTTTRTWLWRFVARILVQTVPWLVAAFVLLVLLTPLPWGLVLAAVGLSLVLTLFFTLTSADELTEVKLVQHGFSAGTGKSARSRRGASF